MLKKITLLLVTSLSLFAMHTAELNINQKDLEAGLKFDVGQFNDNVEPDTMFVGMKMFIPDTSNSADSATLTSLNPYFEGNFMIMRPVGDAGLSLGIGFKLNYTQVNSKSFMSLPIGLEASYELPFPDLIPMFVEANVYYAPEVLSFSDAKNYVEYRINYDLEMIKNVHLNAGYRNIDTKYFSLGRVNYNRSFYLGVKIGF